MGRLKEGLRRAAWLFMALLFLVTTVAVVAIYFLQDSSQQVQTQNQLKGKPMPDFTPVNEVIELQKIDQKIGDGEAVKADSTVTVVYTGAVAATGIVFESSSDTGQPATFPLKEVIKGWTEGLVGMKIGGQRRLLIPADMAYGANPRPGSGIPPNADLVFDITLLQIK